ncbi:hypothetical protein HMPREF0083_05557 [Aneurinibacillus aneurinilyticus ATCC 12856]|uniref:Uncharacterized protein n=1 Tax=Aneurinibacillus aneurinilyticus ATCC 12856 TaxID=649747 RepID=U1WSR9_ANEAE|nr:hypothetical protein HMPREF0083_05557 [Aneurinibacillus aneurinilyticus ATCC 12856]
MEICLFQLFLLAETKKEGENHVLHLFPFLIIIWTRLEFCV